MPLVKLVLPLMAGIVLYLHTGLRLPGHAFVALYAIAGMAWLVSQLTAGRHYGHRWIPGTAVMLLFGLAGFHLAHSHDQRHREDHFSLHHDQGGVLLLQVHEPVAEKANSYQVMARVTHVISDQKAMPASGLLMLYLEKDSLAPTLRPGDLFMTDNRYEAVRPPGNPDQFNYKRFLARRQIHHSTYRRSSQWHATGETRGLQLVRAATHLRESALQVFANHMPQGHEYAVISALLLGYRDLLDEDLQRAFAGAGAMHILCVSGLHVGIIFMVIKVLLARLTRFPGGTAIQVTITLLVIWLYAAITGFSPSVLRASTMFSFVAIGQAFNRRTNIYNTLAASAILLITINPYIITRIGFQLSYLAVISIVALQPKLCGLLKPRHQITKKAWAIITVSVAAQLATGPLALHYFNQFPNYFLLTNLAIIPLSAMIIYSGLLTLAFSFIPVVGYLFGQFLYLLLMALHHIVRFIEGLPWSTTADVHISLPATLLLFMLLGSMLAYLLAGRRLAVSLTLMAALLLLVTATARNMSRQQQQLLVVYQVNNATAIDVIIGRKRLALRCDHLLENPGQSDFHTRQHQIRLGATPPAETRATGHGGWLQIGNHAIAILTKDTPRQSHYLQTNATDGANIPDATNEPVIDNVSAALAGTDGIAEANLLIITGNPPPDPLEVIRSVRPAKVVADASNSFRTLRRWEDACMKKEIPYWPVREKGALVIRLGEGARGRLGEGEMGRLGEGARIPLEGKSKPNIMKSIRTHKELIVFQISFQAGMEVFEITKIFPKTEVYSLTDQIRRSSRSVSGNLAEAFRKRRYPKAFISKLSDAEGEAAETQVWLDYALQCRYIEHSRYLKMYDVYDHILAMIVNMRNNPHHWSM